MVPSADIREGQVHPDVALDQLRDLPQALAQPSAWIIGAGGRAVRLSLDRLQHRHRFERLAPRGLNLGVLRGHVHLFELLGRFGVLHLEAVDSLQRDRRRSPAHRARQYRPQRDRAHRRHLALHLRQRAIHPAILRRLQARRARFHVVLRVEMRSRRVGRAHRVHNRQVLLIEERLERSERRVQSEETVQIDRRAILFRGVVRRPRDGNRRAEVVVGLFAVRHHHVQSVGRAALEDRDQDLLACAGSLARIQSALEPQGRRAHTDHGEGGISKKNRRVGILTSFGTRGNPERCRRWGHRPSRIWQRRL